jgi:hypothetical protein
MLQDDAVPTDHFDDISTTNTYRYKRRKTVDRKTQMLTKYLFVKNALHVSAYKTIITHRFYKNTEKKITYATLRC